MKWYTLAAVALFAASAPAHLQAQACSQAPLYGQRSWSAAHAYGATPDGTSARMLSLAYGSSFEEGSRIYGWDLSAAWGTVVGTQDQRYSILSSSVITARPLIEGSNAVRLCYGSGPEMRFYETRDSSSWNVGNAAIAIPFRAGVQADLASGPVRFLPYVGLRFTPVMSYNEREFTLEETFHLGAGLQAGPVYLDVSVASHDNLMVPERWDRERYRLSASYVF